MVSIGGKGKAPHPNQYTGTVPQSLLQPLFRQRNGGQQLALIKR